MPVRLRPTAPSAADAILVGDPGRALLLAQVLLEKPKMSNHARGLWGYSGQTKEGRELTIQSTGMGGPSAALVLADLAKLGVRRAVRVGTCTAFETGLQLGDLLLPTTAIAAGGSAAAFDVATGGTVRPDPALLERLRGELGTGMREVTVASLDAMPADADAISGASAADMQTVAVLARAQTLGVAAAALLIANELPNGERLEGESLSEAATRAGRAAANSLSNPQAEG